MSYVQDYLKFNYINLIVYNITSNWIYFSLLLFFIALHGIFVGRKNIIIVLMSIELMLISIMLTFIFFSLYLDDLFGQVTALFVLTIGASESAIGLSLIVAYYRSYNIY